MTLMQLPPRQEDRHYIDIRLDMGSAKQEFECFLL